MKKLMPFLPALAFLFVTCGTPTYVYEESTYPRYYRPDPRARYHCTTPADCDKYFEALYYYAHLNHEAQKINLIDHRGFMLEGKVYENPAAGKMMFDGFVYDPNQQRWMHDVGVEMPTPY